MSAQASGAAEKPFVLVLDRAERRLLDLALQTKKALQHRTTEWQPSDLERLAKGLQLAKEGKVISADDALARYRGS